MLVKMRLEGADRDLAFLSSSFILFDGRQRILSMIGLDQCWCVHMVSCLPCVVCFGIPLPLDKILKLSFTSKVAVIDNGFNFVFLGVFDKVRRWPCVVSPVFCGLAIRGQEGCVEDIMDGPGCRELQLICDR